MGKSIMVKKSSPVAKINRIIAMTKFSLPNLDYFSTTNLTNTDPSWGADQDWFLSSNFHRKAGCGPTTATNILAYLSQVHPNYAPLWESPNYTGTDY